MFGGASYTVKASVIAKLAPVLIVGGVVIAGYGIYRYKYTM